MLLDRFLQIETFSLVAIGDFNPVIFQPFWMSSKGLIRDEEAKNAVVDIVHNEILRFELDWLKIEITRTRCEFTTAKEPYFEPLKDLAIGIFEILKETPIKSYGLNHIYDLAFNTDSQYFEIGNKLTPLDLWKEDIKSPRLFQLEIFENERKDGLDGYRRIRITPSDKSISFGVAVNINDHFNINKLDFTTHLEENWNNSFVQAKCIVENMLNKIVN